MSELTEEIYAFILPEMEAHDIEDTIENRWIMLSGLYEGWTEDQSINFEKILYMTALSTEIFSLRLQMLSHNNKDTLR